MKIFKYIYIYIHTYDYICVCATLWCMVMYCCTMWYRVTWVYYNSCELLYIYLYESWWAYRNSEMLSRFTACGCGFASPWAIGHTNPGMHDTQPRVDADLWVQLRKSPGLISCWELLQLGGNVFFPCFFHLEVTDFQVPPALLCVQTSPSADQTAIHNCQHSDRDPTVTPGGRLRSHSDTFANTAALAMSAYRSQIWGNPSFQDV